MSTPAVIDFHAHILPGADHGSSGIEETLIQLDMIKNAGVDTVVATPHFYPNKDEVEDFITRVKGSVEAIKEKEISRPSICIGSEVLYCLNLERMDGLEKLCIRGTNILLLELPMDDWDIDVFETVEALLRRFTVVLVHVDRYIRYNEDEIHDFLQMGALAQINASSLFRLSKKRKIARILETGAVVAIGSDLHKTDYETYGQFKLAPKKLGAKYDEIMKSSAELLKGAQII